MAFVTFLRQEGYERCCTYVETSKNLVGQVKQNPSGRKLEFLGKLLEVQAAQEPSDIIWENLEVEADQKTKNKVKVYGTLAIIFIIIFLLFLQIKEQSTSAGKMFPPQTDCRNQGNMFQDQKEWESFAAIDKKHALNSEGLLIYHCYCQKYSTL